MIIPGLWQLLMSGLLSSWLLSRRHSRHCFWLCLARLGLVINWRLRLLVTARYWLVVRLTWRHWLILSVNHRRYQVRTGWCNHLASNFTLTWRVARNGWTGYWRKGVTAVI